MALAAVVLRRQKISDKWREAGDTLTVEEYTSIPLHVRDAMESERDIKKIFDEEAAVIFADMQRRIEALEKAVFGE